MKKTTTVRLDARSRHKMIVDAAVACAEQNGLYHIDFLTVASKCKVVTSEATVRRYFHTSQDLRDAVIERRPDLANDEVNRE